MFKNRGADILHTKTLLVSGPEDIIFHEMDFTIPVGHVDRAFLKRVWAAVIVGMVNHIVVRSPYHFIGSPAKHFGCRLVDKGDISIGIQAENTFTGGFKDQFHSSLQLLTCRFSLNSFSNLPVQ